MAQNKTIETAASVTKYLSTIRDDKKRTDCEEIIKRVKKITGLEPKMWGTSIVGFGSYHYVYESGREGDSPLLGFSSRASAITLYLGSEFADREELLTQFGKHKTGKGCIYIQKLEDIDLSVLDKMIKNSFEHKKKIHN